MFVRTLTSSWIGVVYVYIDEMECPTEKKSHLAEVDLESKGQIYVFQFINVENKLDWSV